jgi:cation diffusion facilitator CzcD-associated flavoprotein CzcO
LDLEYRSKANLTITFQKIVDTADIVCSAVGILNQWKWPKIPGILDFKGKLVHSAHYDPSYDYTGKRVALIGGGSSGIQILPQIQSKAGHVDHYMKGRTWIPPAGIGGEGLMSRGGNRKSLRFSRAIESTLCINID